MICIPYIINDNYYVARLAGRQESVPYYIIETDSTDMVELFQFDNSFSAFNPDNGMGISGQNDFQFVIREDGCNVTNNQETNNADITIAIERKTNKDCLGQIKHNDFQRQGLSICKNLIIFDLREIGHDSNTVSKINIRLLDITEDLNFNFGLNIADKDHICDIVIDFGSEASQIWTYCRRTNTPWHNGNQMPLYDNIKNASPSLRSITDDNDIYQYDDNDRDLYKSLFFINKTVGTALTHEDFTFINKTSDLLTILKDKLALPNLKLMEHENVPVPSFTFNGASINIFQMTQDIRAEILKFFFGHALKNVNDMAGNNKMACKLTFLVPNTYKQEVLSDIVKDLVNDINSLLDANSNQYTNISQGIEVTTFSESDASFFGWYTPAIFQEYGPERILVVDIGKGTTDFSVLQVNNGNGRIEVERIARSGFVGAGNVMTFAILVTTFKSLAEKCEGCSLAEIIDAIRGIAYHNDYAKKEMLYGYLEQLKRNQILDGRTSLHDFIKSYPGEISNLGSITIDKLNDILKEACDKGCYVDEGDAVINCYADQLANQLIEELKYIYDENIPLDRVVFFGRGAMSIPLRSTIENQLRSINDKLQATMLTNGIKTGCLRGPLNESLVMDHMNMTIVGWPQQKNFRRQKISKNTNDGISPWKKNFKWITTLFGDDSNSPKEETAENEIDEIRNLINRTVVSSDSRTLSRIQGQKVFIGVNDNLFVLGNRRCHIDNRESLGEKHIFFDGENFIARDANDSYEFIYQENPVDDHFITETFFPMTSGDSEGINLPVIEHILNQVSPVIADPTTEGTSSNHNDDDDFTATPEQLS